MRITIPILTLLFIPTLSLAGKRSRDLAYAIEIARNADTVLTTPSLSPEEIIRLRKENAGAVDKIESIANSEPKDTETQLEVSRSLASVSEAPRAVPFAERGLKLAETSGDKKLIRTALLTGSEVYYRAGNYKLARDRAQRILKNDPKDKDALALYMLVKDRDATLDTSPRSGATESAARSAGRADDAPAETHAEPRGLNVAMTNAFTLEARKQIALGWSRLKLDPSAALKHFDAAVAADPKNASIRAQRAKARLGAADAVGALEDADAALALEPRLGEAYAVRAEAKRALGRDEVELLADYEAAAKLDGDFTDAYKTALLRINGAPGIPSAGEGGGAGAAAPDGPRGLFSRLPKGWGLPTLIAALTAALGVLLMPLALKRRRSDEDGSSPR